MTFSVMIASRNRRDELRRTLAHLRDLDPQPDEVLICADGCVDDTASMVRAEFPNCTVSENATARGSVFCRDRLLRMARGDVVLSLDDDSYPVERDFLTRLGLIMAEHPEAAVVTFTEIRGEQHAIAGAGQPSGAGQYVAAYPNCAAAMRRQFYLCSLGFPTFFGHMYEEPDYAVQCYAAGFGVWFEPRWWVLAAWGWKDVIRSRSAVPWRVYRTWLSLNRRTITSFRELRASLPAAPLSKPPAEPVEQPATTES